MNCNPLQNLRYWFVGLILAFAMPVSAQTTVQIGTGTSTFGTGTSHGGPYGRYYTDGKSSFIYTQTELTNAGITAGSTINAIGFNVPSALNGVGTIPGFSISMLEISGTTFSNTTFLTGQTQVLASANYAPVVGWNTHMLTTPFIYNGGDLVVTTCFEDPISNNWSENASVEYSTVSNAEQYYYSDTNPAACSQASASSTGSSRPNVQLTFTPATACSGPPTGGSAVSSLDSACLGQSYTLSLQGATSASGLTYQWEERPVGTTTWMPVGSSFSYSTTMTQSMEYQCIVSCGALTATSTIKTVSQKQFYNCACASSAQYTADGEIYNVTVGTLNNTSTCLQTGGPGSQMNQYSDYSNLPATTLGQGAQYPISVTAGACNGYPYDAWVKVWIDFDHDGAFTSVGEEVFSGTTPSTQYTPAGDIASGSILIPLTANLGTTRMRVILWQANSGTPVVPCQVGSPYNYGETEDYLVDIVTAPACATVTAGAAQSSKTSACSGTSFTLSATGYTVGQSGLIYQWQSSPAGLNSFNDIIAPGSNNVVYTINNQSASTDYRLSVLCANTSAIDYSTPVTVTQDSFFLCYCSPNTGNPLQTSCGTGDNIDSVSIVGTTLGYGASTPYGYVQTNPGIPTQTATIAQGVTYDLYVRQMYTGGGMDVWFDWDMSGTFDATEYFNIPINNSSYDLTLNFTVPVINTGNIGMRIRHYYSSYGSGGACSNNTGCQGYETEDYVVNIAPQPSCLPPSAMQLQSTGATTATINWTSAAAQHEIEYAPGTSAFPIGTGTRVSTTNPPPYQITGLSPNTQYFYYVRAICGANDTSSWTSGSVFTTQCTAISTFPWTYDVENQNANTNSVMNNCWTSNPTNTFAYAWNVSGTGTTPSSNTGPTSAHSGSKFFFTEASNGGSTGVTTADLTSPLIDVTSLSAPVLEFYYHMYGIAIDRLVIQVHDGVNWNRIDSIVGQQQTVQTNPWLLKTIPLSGYTGNIQIRFTGVYGGSFEGDISVDDITVMQAPTCPAPTSVSVPTTTSASATIQWTSAAAQHEIEYAPGSSPFTIGTGTRVSTTNPSPYTVTALSPNTTYYFYIRAVCGANDTSTWTPGSFTTPCAPIATLPWTENFDAMSSIGYNIVPGCWYRENGDWYTSNSTTYNTPYSGSNYLSCAYAANNEYVWTPGFQLTANVSYDISFYVQGDGDPNWTVDVFENTVQSSTLGAPVQLGSTYIVPGTSCCSIQPYYKVTRTVVPTTSGVYYYGIRVNEPTGGPWYVAFDDFMMEVTPTCIAPTGANVPTPAATTATGNWTPSPSNPANGYEWRVFPQGTGPYGTPTASGTVGTAASSASITGLTAMTNYTFYVRGHCSATDSTTWTFVNFTTACATAVGQYSQNFNANMTPNCWTNSTTPESWLFANASTGGPNYGVGGSADHTGNGGYFAWVDGSGSGTSQNITLTSVPIDISGFTAPNLSFYMKSYNNSDGALNKLVVEVFDGTTWTQIDSIQQNYPNANWYNRQVVLPSLASTTIQIRFVVDESNAGGSAFNNDILLDDVVITDGPLAIKLEDISAANIGKANRVDWTTLSEELSDRFELERSIDGRNFSVIAKLDATGRANHYSYVDNEAVTGINYYRLNMKDASGKGEYSKVVSAIVGSKTAFNVSAYPNPVSNDLTVKVNGVQGRDAAIQVMDITGKVLRTINMTSTVETINMSGFANGIYMIKYSDANHSQTIRINKQ